MKRRASYKSLFISRLLCRRPEGVNDSAKHWRHSLVTDDNGLIYSITVNEMPNPKYSMTNYYNADEAKDCLDLWGK